MHMHAHSTRVPVPFRVTTRSRARGRTSHHHLATSVPACCMCVFVCWFPQCVGVFGALSGEQRMKRDRKSQLVRLNWSIMCMCARAFAALRWRAHTVFLFTHYNNTIGCHNTHTYNSIKHMNAKRAANANAAFVRISLTCNALCASLDGSFSHCKQIIMV